MFGLYILAAVFAGLVYIVSYNTIPMLTGLGSGKMVGASASIMAILVATAVYSPSYKVRLMLIGTVELWHIAIVFIVLDLINVSVENQGGHLAHLAGALFGYLYIKALQNDKDLSVIVSDVIGFFENLFKPRKKSSHNFKVHRNTKKNKSTTNPTSRGTQAKNVTQRRIDDILDKISKSGYDSLTKEEKEFLFKVGK